MISADLGQQLEQFVSSLVATGRYNSKSEVLREGVRLIHEKETRLAALDASIARGLADAEAGRTAVSPSARRLFISAASRARSASRASTKCARHVDGHAAANAASASAQPALPFGRASRHAKYASRVRQHSSRLPLSIVEEKH